MNKDSKPNIENMYKKKDIKNLIKSLAHEDYNISSNAAHTLVLMRQKREFEVFKQLLFSIKKGEGFLDRSKIVKGLSDTSDKRVVEILIQKLDDKDSMSRCMAARTLGRIGDEKAVEPLIKLLEDEEFNVRLEAVESLGEIRDERAVEPLIKLLKDEDKYVRCNTAFTLFALGDKRSVKPLRSFLKDEDSDIPHMKAILTFTLEDLEEKHKPHPSTLEESVTIEFKSSLRYDIRKNCVNEELGKAVVKTIAAFLNTLGGTLYIGVLNDGSICGIENDIKTLGSPNRDSYKRALAQVIINYLGLLLNQYLYIDFEEWEGKTICRVNLDPSREPIYFKGEEGKEFFIRFGPTTRKLDKKETKNYIISRWSRRKLNDFNKSNS